MSRIRDYTPVHPSGLQAPPALIWCTTPERWLPLQYRPHVVRQGGGQVWEERAHDRGQAVTEWAGKRLHTLTLALFFSATRTPGKTDVEPECALLHQMMTGPDWDQSRGEPPPIRLNFGPGQQLRWVITDLVWDDIPVIDARGRRTQTGVSVELLELVRPVLADGPASLAKRMI